MAEKESKDFALKILILEQLDTSTEGDANAGIT